MKKSIFFTLSVCIFISLSGFSQTKNPSHESISDFNSRPGFINITELNSGLGLYRINVDYSKHIVNLSSIFGIGLAKNFTGGIGFGVSFYNGGPLVPLLVDFRYFTNIGNKRFFVFGDGGMLLNSANTIGGLAYFVNPGLGMILPISKNLSASMGAGLITQFRKDSSHDSFIILKTGMMYSFNKSRNQK